VVRAHRFRAAVHIWQNSPFAPAMRSWAPFAAGTPS
jgi:hypothetical protein